MVLDAKYMSFHLFVALPKSYVMFALGIKFPPTVEVTTKLAVDKLPDTVKLVNVPTLVIFGCALVVTVAADPLAFPVNSPTNDALVILVNPATVVTVDPKVYDVLPNVKLALASLA